MFLKNYTSLVDVGTTIQRIVSLLVKVGVAQIAMDYAPDGAIVGVTFSAPMGGRIVPIRLPVDVQGALDALWDDYRGTDRTSGEGDAQTCWNGRKRLKKGSFRPQAQRTAWRLMQDWLEVQISMVQLKQADVLQVFLPYAWDGQQSFYHRLKAGGFAALPAPSKATTVNER